MHKGKKMNRQRKVVITTTYNELGIIVDTKAEELDLSAQPNLQLTCNQLATDLISRQAAIDAALSFTVEYCGAAFDENMQIGLKQCLDGLPSAEPWPWHDAETPPDTDRLVLITFANYSVPVIGRFEGNDEEGYTAYVGDSDDRFIDEGLIVDGWYELPKRQEA